MSEKILIVDDDVTQLRIANKMLREEYEILTATNGQNALALIQQQNPDVILLDIEMPNMNGYEVMTEINNCINAHKEVEIPVIFITSHKDDESELTGFNMGAYDFIRKPFNPEIMKIRIKRTIEVSKAKRLLAERAAIAESEAKLKTLESNKDALTDLWNRKYTEEQVNIDLANGNKGCLFMLDMDNFKSVNDTYGHKTGDEILKIFAEVLTECTRAQDIVCRVGGDEFILYSRDANTPEIVTAIAIRIIERFKARKKLFLPESQVSVSIGICLISNGESFTDAYSIADAALYEAKNAGKNTYHIIKSVSGTGMEHKQNQ